MDLLKISAISYLNTFPFVYGLEQSGMQKNFQLELDVPSLSAEKLQDEKVDIALVPVGALPGFPEYHLISPYCVGATNAVKTVLLLSQVPLARIRTVHLDFDSRTSIELVRVLSKNFWNISPAWKKLNPGEAVKPAGYESLVAIGDKTFEIRHHFPYVYDLAEEWIRFTGLPFVFSVWASKKNLPDWLVAPFIEALSWGVRHKRGSIEYFKDKLPACDDCLDYLENNISYSFDKEKRKGFDLFLSYLK